MKKFSLQLFNSELFKVERIKVAKVFASEFELFTGRFFRIFGDVQITQVNRVGDYYKLLLRGVPEAEAIIEAAVSDDIGILYRITTKNKDTAIIEIFKIEPKHTCYYCNERSSCEFAFDDYNVEGDCLMMK